MTDRDQFCQETAASLGHGRDTIHSIGWMHWTTYPVLSQEDDAKVEICLITQEKIENSHLARIRKVLCFSAPRPDPSLANSGTVDQ